MRRNPNGRAQAAAVRQAVAEAQRAAGGPPAGIGGVQGAASHCGWFNAETGLFEPAGRLGRTPLGQFKLVGPPFPEE